MTTEMSTLEPLFAWMGRKHLLKNVRGVWL